MIDEWWIYKGKQSNREFPCLVKQEYSVIDGVRITAHVLNKGHLGQIVLNAQCDLAKENFVVKLAPIILGKWNE